MSAATSDLERLYEPEWAGAWTVARILFACACLLNLGMLYPAIGDAIAAPDMVFTTGYYRLSDYLTFTRGTATLLWVLGMLAAALTVRPGRSYKPALLVFSVCWLLLIMEEALNVKAYDRLMFWMLIGFFLSPAHETNLQSKWRSPLARYWMLAVFISIYGSTGVMKVALDPGWFDGSVLSWHLVHQFHANNRLAAWMSGQPWLLAPMCWLTLIFELGFPILIWFRKTNPWILLLGASFHLGLLCLMSVGPFPLVALSAYPILLHPDVGQELFRRVSERLGTPQS